jgi:D-threo-aldose 1-dehydrogenase
MTEPILPGTLRSTSRIGFGTSGLSGQPTHKESIALLETAFDAGIRHFDTAPIYGAGASEQILGDFLVRKRDEVTVTTKFGLTPQRARPLLSHAKNMIRPMLHQIPRLKSRFARSIKGLHRPANYSAAAMNRSLGASLRALRCDRIDLFLLHEADATDISDDLRKALDDSVHAGLIGAWGVGSSRDKIDRVVASDPRAGRVLQFEWSVLSDRPPVYGDSFCIIHGALSSSLARIKLLFATPERRRHWSKEIDIDISDGRALPSLMVRAALAANSGGIVLFSSQNMIHTRDIASLLQRHDDETLHKFLTFVDRNRTLIAELTKSNVTGPM